MTDLHNNDDQLLKGVVEGNEDAFVALYEKYWKKLYNYGYSKLGKREIVEGFVQEIFIDLWMKRSTIDIHTSVSSYLFTALKYKVLNYHKAHSIREKYVVTQKLKGETKVSEVEEEVLFKDLKSQIHQVIVNFPSQRKKAYELRFNEELSYIEIADTMAISVSTVEKHIIKSLKIIRDRLKICGLGSTAMMLIEINL